jgi:histidinol-phosphate/aromatic aminotransferase/cobyric acid decarboxylase-like protein
LITKYNILKKNLKGKNGIHDNAMRIAVRDTKDNDHLLSALKEILEDI